MRILPAIILLASAALPALAQSNIGLTQYPAPKCAVPPPVDPALKPAPPPDNATEAQAGIYNSRVRAYNTAMRAHNDGVKAYADCVQGYIAAGKADIGRIQAALDAAVAAANSQ
ncbi:MAG: hypothetical protein JO256_00655 [Alphaproteobacteria bacterium]|nr:hypothetical protein [Alphaproteobacteria bacterium]